MQFSSILVCLQVGPGFVNHIFLPMWYMYYKINGVAWYWEINCPFVLSVFQCMEWMGFSDFQERKFPTYQFQPLACNDH